MGDFQLRKEDACQQSDGERCHDEDKFDQISKERLLFELIAVSNDLCLLIWNRCFGTNLSALPCLHLYIEAISLQLKKEDDKKPSIK